MRSTGQIVHTSLSRLPQPIALRQDIQNCVTIADDLLLVRKSDIIVTILINRDLFSFVQQVVHLLVINLDVSDAENWKIENNFQFHRQPRRFPYRIINVRSDSFSSNNCRTASAVMPGSSSFPSIVWVLPGE